MYRLVCSATVLGIALAAGAASGAEQHYPIPLRFVTVDGTWDCRDATGAPLGAVVALGSAYGLIDTESKPAGYGVIKQTGEDNYDLPHHLILDGPLKDLGYVGTSMRGPADDYENYSLGFFLELVKADGNSAECVRRTIDGMVQ